MNLKHRSLIGITLLEIVTLGIYKFYWYFITKTELNVVNGKDVKVPFFLWFFVPIVNIWWFWRFAKSIERITENNVSRWSAFLAPVLLEFIGAMFVTFIYRLAFPSIYMTPWWVSALTATVVILLPVYYYQSNLNKYAK